MHIEMLKDKKKRIINCLNHKGEGCGEIYIDADRYLYYEWNN